MAQGFHHILAALGGLALLAFPVLAQGPAVPQRDCSPEDIRQALAGAYTGPPCRFTEMPAGAQPAPRADFQADVRRLAGARQTRGEALHNDGEVVTYAGDSMSRSAHHDAGVREVRNFEPTRRHREPRPAPQPEPVRLSDSFFTGPLAGGVERPFTPIYSYRGIVLISASGETRTGFSGVRHLTRRTRALDPHRTGPARAYPYD